MQCTWFDKRLVDDNADDRSPSLRGPPQVCAAKLVGGFDQHGGYLIGFVLASGVVGWLAERGWDRRLPSAAMSFVVGNGLIYVVGLPWLRVATGFTIDETIAKGLTPFVVGDAIKVLLASAALPASWWIVRARSSDDRRPSP